MRYRPILYLLAALLALAGLLLAGCGAGSSGPGGLVSAAAAPAGWQAHPPIHGRPAKRPGPPAPPPSLPVGYTPAQIRHAYGFDKIAGDGTGQTIAIVDAYGSPTIQKDLNTFCAQFGLPTTTVQIIQAQSGKLRTNAGWALETSLDVEWAHAIAPGAKILLVVAKDASFANLLAAVQTAVDAGATQVSMSWGGSEFSGETTYNSYFSKPGVTFTASSGDSGGGAQWPAASPYVTAVGGTHLPLDIDGNLTSAETAWSGSNGGPSAYEAAPSYQNGFQSTGQRTIPDVAYVADLNTGVAVYDSTSYQGHTGWFQVGGTSVGAPQWAALMARVNSAPSGGTDSALYALGSPSTLSTYFRDITWGSNGGYSAATGYDMVTGLGSPLAGALVPAL